MDRITRQSPRQRGYGSTSSPRNVSLKHTRKLKKGREESNQEAKLTESGGPSGRRGGLSARASRTVRQCTADCPHRYGGPSGLGRGLSVKTNRTTRSEPQKTDRPRGARGLSARHPRTVRPLLRTVRNFVQPKLKNTTDQNERRARTRRTPDELVRRGPSSWTPRTVREARTEQKNSPTSKVNSPKSSSDFPNG
jgi:hypothetical protein